MKVSERVNTHRRAVGITREMRLNKCKTRKMVLQTRPFHKGCLLQKSYGKKRFWVSFKEAGMGACRKTRLLRKLWESSKNYTSTNNCNVAP